MLVVVAAPEAPASAAWQPTVAADSLVLTVIRRRRSAGVVVLLARRRRRGLRGRVHRGKDPGDDADGQQEYYDASVEVEGRVRDGLHVLQGLYGRNVVRLQLQDMPQVQGGLLNAIL